MKYLLPLFILSFLLTACGSGKPSALADSGYHVRGPVVWYKWGFPSQAFEVVGADAATFRYPIPGPIESSVYATDKANVYYAGKPLKGADPASFRMHDATYARDLRHVYYNDLVVCDDPDHFQVLSALYAKNSHAVFWRGPFDKPMTDRIVSRNPAGFRLLERSGPVFFADGDELIAGGKRYPDIRAADFVYLGDSYWRAGSRAFYHDDEMPEGTIATALKPLTGQYATDGQRVYYLGRVLEGADPATFTVTDPKWPRAKDARQEYDQGKAVERVSTP